MSHCATTFAMVSLFSAAVLARGEDRDVPAFHSVQIAAGIHGTVEIGPRRPVHLEADEKLLRLVETRVENGTLKVGFLPHTSWSGDSEVTVAIQTPELRSLGASGGSVVRATFTRGAETGIQASGGSEIRARGVDAQDLSIQGSGGAQLDVQGRADTLDLQMSGGTQLHGRDLAVRDVSVQASGGSQGEFRASGRIRGQLSGGSELHVSGGAKAKVATSGGSAIDVND